MKNLKKKLNHVASLLCTRVLGFCFQYGPDSSSDGGGILLSLVFMCVATLMSLFRAFDLKQSVSQDALAILIVESGKALLDPRLATPPHSPSNLDEATSSQLVRAINKVNIFSVSW